MKNFNFKSVTNTKEAAKLATGRATFLAGGMSLLPAMKLRLAAYSDLINIKKIIKSKVLGKIYYCYLFYSHLVNQKLMIMSM